MSWAREVTSSGPGRRRGAGRRRNNHYGVQVEYSLAEFIQVASPSDCIRLGALVRAGRRPLRPAAGRRVDARPLPRPGSLSRPSEGVSRLPPRMPETRKTIAMIVDIVSGLREEHSNPLVFIDPS